MIGLRTFLALSTVAFFGAGCTAFVASQLSGDSSDGGPGQVGAGCFHVTDNVCGECIVSHCENPTGNPPVSLAAVCSESQYDSITLAVEDCTQNPGLDNYSCSEMYIDGGTYATSIDTAGAAVSNLEHCITDNCVPSCSQCNVQVPTCQSESVSLAEAGACGQCFDEMMNTPGGGCQSYVLAPNEFNEAVCGSLTTAISKCAVPSGSCSTADCSGVSSPTSSDPAVQNAFACLWQQCASSCQ